MHCVSFATLIAISAELAIVGAESPAKFELRDALEEPLSTWNSPSTDNNDLRSAKPPRESFRT